jgi:hypothetical protein
VTKWLPIGVFFVFFFPVAAAGQCAFPIAGVTTGVSNINFTALGTPPANAPANALSDAINIWAYGCSSGYGFGYPSMSEGPYSGATGTMNVYVIYHAAGTTAPSGRCGETDVYINQSTGQIDGATIDMYTHQGNGQDCTATWANLLAHEIGHVLGLGDADGITRCNGTIMGSNPSYVSSDQCEALKDNWQTPEEDAAGGGVIDPQDACDGLTGYGNPCSPIVINLSDGPWKLTGPDAPVLFDIDADGVRNRITWTGRGEPLGFLALDRNDNGLVDSGSELFGTSTVLRNGVRARNGFDALREFDSNGDGVIDAGDHIWSELLLWVDANHDGVSQQHEIAALRTHADIVALGTVYGLVQRRDCFGNTFRYMSRLRLKHGFRPYYDIFFVPVQ